MMSRLSLSALGGCVAGLLAFAASGAPLPVEQNGPTWQQWNAQLMAWDRAEIVEPHRAAVARESIPCDERAVALLERCIDLYHHRRTLAEVDAMVDEAIEVVDQGCDAPEVLYALGWGQDEQNHLMSAERNLRRAVEGLAAGEYPPIRLAIAASRLAEHLDAWSRPNEATDYYQVAVGAWIEAVRQAPRDAEHQRRLVGMLQQLLDGDTLPEHLGDQLIARLQTAGDVDPCTLHTLSGIWQAEVAWLRRGTRFANDVSDKQWEGFAHHIAIGSAELHKAYACDPQRPEAATIMIRIAMAGHAEPGESERLWFDRAVAARFDWPDAYSQYRYALLPRWGGSWEQMLDFGKECAATEQFDTLVPYVLIDVLSDLCEDDDYSTRIWKLLDIYPTARHVLQQYIEIPSWSRDLRWNQTALAVIAWGMGGHVDALRMIDELQGDLDDRTVKWLVADEHAVVDDTLIETSRIADDFNEAARAARQGEFERAAELYEAAAARTDDARIKRIIRDRIVTARALGQFDAGEWVPLRFEPDLPGWRPRRGIWHSSVPAVIKGASLGDELFLVNEMPVGRRWELRGRIDTTYLQRDVNLGIAFEYQFSQRGTDWMAFLIYPNDNKVQIGYRFEGERIQTIKLKGKKASAHDFLLQVWNEAAVLAIDGETVFADQIAVASRARLGEQFGLCGSLGPNTGYGKFRDLEIRRLKSQPAALRQGEPGEKR